MLSPIGFQFMNHVQGNWPVANLSETDTTWVLSIFALSLIFLGVAAMHHCWIQKSS
jgi:hypothetical protein